MYARTGITEVWITVLPERVIEAHAYPVGGASRRFFSPNDTTTLSCFPDIALPVSEILPG